MENFTDADWDYQDAMNDSIAPEYEELVEWFREVDAYALATFGEQTCPVELLADAAMQEAQS